MEQKHRTILRHQWSNIRDNLEPNNILPKLVLVLGENDEEKIREKSTRQERCDKLLNILPTRGENAFNVFVNALVKEAPHLASELTEADTKTEDELNHAREQSAKLRGEIRKLKTELEAAKEEQEKIKRLQREQLKDKITKKTLEFERILAREQQIKRNLKISLEKIQAESKDKDVLLKNMRGEKKRLQEESNAERSKRDALSEEARRLKEMLKHERDSAERKNQTWEKEIQKWRTKSEKYEQENQALQKSLESAMKIQGELQLLSSDLETANKEQQEQIRQLQRMNEELQDKVTNESKLKILAKIVQQHTDESCSRCDGFRNERDSARRENQILQLSSRELEAEKEEQQQKITQLEKENTELGDKVTKQTSELARLHEEVKAERSKCDELREKVKRWREMPGRIHNHIKDFDTNGVVYALTKSGPNSIQKRIIIATRSSNQVGEASDILENRVDREIVSGTEAEEQSWWCVDLTENYALYLTHYTLRHGYHTSNSFLLNWQLKGSLDGENWETLSRHVKDRGLKGNDRYQTHTWAIDGDYSAFRYFKILQTGINSSGNLGIFLSGIELYGVLTERGS